MHFLICTGGAGDDAGGIEKSQFHQQDLMMLTTRQIGEALGISYQRACRLMSRPFCLPYVVEHKSSGARERLFSISVVLPRIKDAGYTEHHHIAKLFELGGYTWKPIV